MKSLTKKRNMELVVKSEVIIGIDAAKNKHDARFFSTTDSSEVAEHMVIQNSRSGFSEFEERLSRWDRDTILIGIESTGVYDKSLVNRLLMLGYTIVRVNTMHVSRAKGMFESKYTKTDHSDCGSISFLVKAGSFSIIRREDSLYIELEHIVTARRKQVKTRATYKTRIQSLLDACLPESKCFSNRCAKSLLALLKKYGLKGVKDTPHKTAKVNLLVKTARGSLTREKAQHIIDSFSYGVGSNDGLRGANIRLQTYISTLEKLNETITELESYIEHLMNTLCETQYLLSIPGVGMQIAAQILAETGPFSKYRNPVQIVKLAGLSLKQNSSGTKSGRIMITRVGNQNLREALFHAAIHTVATKGMLRNYYFARKEKNKRPGLVNLVPVSKKIVRIMFGLVKNATMYNPNLVQA